MGPRDLHSAPYSPVHCSSHSMTSFQSSELTEPPVVENSQLFAQRTVRPRCQAGEGTPQYSGRTGQAMAREEGRRSGVGQWHHFTRTAARGGPVGWPDWENAWHPHPPPPPPKEAVIALRVGWHGPNGPCNNRWHAALLGTGAALHAARVACGPLHHVQKAATGRVPF